MISRRPYVALLCCAALALLATRSGAAPAVRGLPDFTALVEQVRPAVVNVSTVGGKASADGDQAAPEGHQAPQLPEGTPFDELLRKFFEDRGREMPNVPRESLGSGFIISQDGYILTNRHVVRGGNKIVVRLSDRREFNARVVGMDKSSDIALLKIEAKGLPVVRIGDSNRLKVGEWVLAIGSPFGFDHSVTAGIVSAKGRALPNENYVPFIQTDVAINPGNSGGPLFNLNGEVVGVNSQIFSRTGGYMGLSFAIPSDTAMRVVEQLKTSGKVSRGWLGVFIQDVNGDLAQSFGLDKPYGALVARVLPDSPAAKAGIHVGDVIIKYDGRVVEHSSALPPMVGNTAVGSKARVTVIRNRKPIELSVAIRELPDAPQAEAQAPEPKPQESLNNRLGLAITLPTDAQREALDLSKNGVIVERVAPGPAEQAGLRAGDAIAMLDGVKITSVDQFHKVVKGLGAGKLVSVLVHRKGGPLFLTLRLPPP